MSSPYTKDYGQTLSESYSLKHPHGVTQDGVCCYIYIPCLRVHICCPVRLLRMSTKSGFGLNQIKCVFALMDMHT